MFFPPGATTDSGKIVTRPESCLILPLALQGEGRVGVEHFAHQQAPEHSQPFPPPCPPPAKPGGGWESNSPDLIGSQVLGRLQTSIKLFIAMMLVGGLMTAPIVYAQGAKKPRVEEEEEPLKKEMPKKDGPIEPKAAPKPLAEPGLQHVATELAKAKNYFIRDYLGRIALPYDNLVPARGVRPYKIFPLPDLTLPEAKFSYLLLLNDDLTKGIKKELPTGSGFSLQPYEEIVLEETNRMLDPKMAAKLDGMKRDDLEDLAVRILQGTRSWHAGQVEKSGRVGKGWQAVDEKLRRRIIEIRCDQLKASMAAKNWKRAEEIAGELSNFGDDPIARKEIYKLLLRKAMEAVGSDRDEDYVALREALNQYENIAGGRGDELALAARRQLTVRAKQYAGAARKQSEDNQNGTAINLLKNAEALDPDLPDIQKLRSKLRDRVLYVGVPRLPERLSPAGVRDESEQWGMELLFESLLEAVPDAETGRRFRPQLAVGLPKLASLERDFTLSKSARWSNDGKSLDARDVLGTLELLRAKPQLGCSDGLDVLALERARIDDNPFSLRLHYSQGVLEPLGRTTFKVLPARYLKANNLEVDDDAFAHKPFGSGPFRYEGREADNGDREAAVFRANPYYSQRNGKFGLPNIREIRFIVPKLSNVGADFAGGQLHLALDVPTADIVRYRDDPRVVGLVDLHTPALNRRIWMLAINHRRQALQNVDLRRGLSAAIDRDLLINEVFRTETSKNYHRPLAGPFPPNSWATPEKARKSEGALYNKALAGGLLNAAAGKNKVTLRLVVPDDDALAIRACNRMKEMIEAAAKKTGDDAPSVEIVLDPVTPKVFWWKIEREQDFDLAYIPYDFKDDQYWLGSLLDPAAAVPGGRNLLGYLAEEAILNPTTERCAPPSTTFDPIAISAIAFAKRPGKFMPSSSSECRSCRFGNSIAI